jgi:hypothetical protein
MDMKKILQAMDGVSTKPVEGADSMARFLRVVQESETTLPAVTPIKVPPIPQLPAQDGDLGDGVHVRTNRNGTRTYSSGIGMFTYDAQGKAITYTSPSFSGASKTIDLTNNQSTQNYNAGPLATSQRVDANGKPLQTKINYDLGVATIGHDNDHVSGIRSTEVAPRVGDGTDADATLAAAHQMMPTSAIAAARGVDPAKFAAFQKQNPTAVKENSLSKFLSIVRKNDVSMLSEGANPHRVALPVQMAMQHYQQTGTKPQPRERLIDKYFVEAETNLTQRKEEKRAVYNQYAKTIANRVLMKESAQGVAEGSDPNKLAASVTVDGEFKEFDLTPLIAKNNWVGTPKQVINQADTYLGDFFRKRGSAYSNLKLTYKGMTLNANQVGDVGAPDPEFESIAEAPIAMDPAEPNNPTIHNHQKANTMTLKGRIMSARAQLQELAELSESDSLLVWEQICKKAKGGMFMGLEQNLEQIRHGIEQLAAKRKQGGRGSRGITPGLGEGKRK